jgi:hypothetical protein
MVVVDIQAMPGSITDNFAQYKEQLDREMQPYQGAVVVEANYRDAYKSRADLKKVIDALETKRKAVKRDYLMPYDEFEAKYKYMVASLTDTWRRLDEQIKSFDQKKLEEKTRDINEMIDERLAKEPDYIDKLVRSCPFAMWDKSWENKTTSMKEITSVFEERVESIKDHYVIISEYGEFAPEMLEFYTKSGSITDTLRMGSKLKERKANYELTLQKARAVAAQPSVFDNVPMETQEIQMRQPQPEPHPNRTIVLDEPFPANEKEKTVVKVAMTLSGPAFTIKWLMDAADLVGISHERFNPNK